MQTPHTTLYDELWARLQALSAVLKDLPDDLYALTPEQRHALVEPMLALYEEMTPQLQGRPRIDAQGRPLRVESKSTQSLYFRLRPKEYQWLEDEAQDSAWSVHQLARELLLAYVPPYGLKPSTFEGMGSGNMTKQVHCMLSLDELEHLKQMQARVGDTGSTSAFARQLLRAQMP